MKQMKRREILKFGVASVFAPLTLLKNQKVFAQQAKLDWDYSVRIEFDDGNVQEIFMKYENGKANIVGDLMGHHPDAIVKIQTCFDMPDGWSSSSYESVLETMSVHYEARNGKTDELIYKGYSNNKVWKENNK